MYVCVLLLTVFWCIYIISGDNPVIDLDKEDLQEEMDRITGMGNPVQSFLTSEEFTSVDPASAQNHTEVYI